MITRFLVSVRLTRQAPLSESSLCHTVATLTRLQGMLATPGEAAPPLREGAR